MSRDWDSPTWRGAMPYLRCPRCRDALIEVAISPDALDGVLGHDGTECDERYPVIGGIPRLLLPEMRHALLRERGDWFRSGRFAGLLPGWAASSGRRVDLEIASRFDREWVRFRAVDLPELRRIFDEYFDIVPSALIGSGAIVVDAGCGSGRWTYELASRGARAIALDLGLSIEVAERNTRSLRRVACVQADVRSLPLADGCADLACSLGVLHHIPETERGIGELARVTRHGGGVLVYLYYALDGRPLYYRTMFRVADAMRQVTSRLPEPLLVAVAATIAVGIYLPLARVSTLLRSIRPTARWDALPLNYYAGRSLRTMMNDSLDRFGTKLEKRFTRDAVRRLLSEAGAVDIVVSRGPPYWHALGIKPDQRITPA